MSKSAPTPEQIARQIIAADPTQSVWVGANAGTGKTRVLIDRILRLLLEGVPPTRILCLTFTKAASAEMATRLSKQLGEWAVSSDEELIPELTQMMGRNRTGPSCTGLVALHLSGSHRHQIPDHRSGQRSASC